MLTCSFPYITIWHIHTVHPAYTILCTICQYTIHCIQHSMYCRNYTMCYICVYIGMHAHITHIPCILYTAYYILYTVYNLLYTLYCASYAYYANYAYYAYYAHKVYYLYYVYHAYYVYLCIPCTHSVLFILCVL